MKTFATGLFVSLAALTVSSGAMAADALIMVDEEAIVAATSNWDGFYVGIGGAFLSSTTIVETIWAVQGTIGANMTMDSFLLGAEAYLSINNTSLGGPPYYAIGAEVRGGVVVTDPVLIYVALGGEFVQGGNTYATLGGGIEFMATDDLSLDIEYKYYLGLNGPWRGHSISASANWHF